MKHAVSPLWSAAVMTTMTTMLVGWLASSGCGSSGADCTAAANNAVALIRVDLTRELAAAEAKPDSSEEGEAVIKELRRKESMLPALKEELVTSCKGENWNISTRKCMANAKALGVLVECDPDKNLGLPPDAETDPDQESEPTDEPADSEKAADDGKTGDEKTGDEKTGDEKTGDEPAAP